MLELLTYDFFRNALLAAVLAAVSCGIIGTYIVSKRIVFISGGITHASFGGIGMGYFFGINPILGAAVFAVLSALGIEYASRKTDVREDSAIAILWALGMAIGVIFVYMTPGYAPNLLSYLFGNILTVGSTDLFLLLGLCVIILIFFALQFKNILYIAFDEEYARARRLPVNLIKYIMISLVALTIVFNIRVVGIILVISLLTIPQTIANMFVKRFFNIMVLSVLIALLGTVSGLVLSYLFDIPSGAAIIFFLVILFFLARLMRWIGK
ncbi:MAG: metal ABC transporter permease [Bacteroidetes bacterium]|nr:metal ABC transporter permease [Bacteroidota bacterium]MCK5766298.1 metal ABC transporter permease [Bacteroidales bacterium]